LSKHFVFLPNASLEAIERECASSSFTHIHILAHGHRIGQEALALAAKHSEASQAVLRLSQGPDAVTLEIEDDGRSSSEESSLGMRIMKQRSRLIGAALRLESNGGTRIVCTLPRDH
jgi:signal transduction histidine kinase